jgi:tripartite-type tricarboxylate transporter receptor subunit TctC
MAEIGEPAGGIAARPTACAVAAAAPAIVHRRRFPDNARRRHTFTGGNSMRSRLKQALMVAALLAAPWSFAQSQAFPSRAIHLVVGAPVGSGMDLGTRILAERLRDDLGQPVIVENRPGADGIIAAQAVAAAPPDGYTLLPSTNSQMTINPVINRNLAYDPLRDFEPIAMYMRVPMVLVVNASVPVNSVAELIAYAKANPTLLNYGSGSSVFMFITESFKSLAGIEMRHIPYNGVPPVVAGLLAGDVQVGVVNLAPAAAHIKSGKLKALAVMNASREPLVADVPAIAEAGVRGFDLVVWIGMFAPAGTPPEIVARLNDAIVRAIAVPEVREKMLAAGVITVPSSPAALGATVRRELDLIGRVAKSAGIAAR